MRSKLLFLIFIPCILFPCYLGAQEIMPQGIFVQTCSPALGETFEFLDKQFLFFSDDQKYFGQGTYKLNKNRLNLTYNEPERFPNFRISSIPSDPGKESMIIIKFFSPGKHTNQVGIQVELFNHKDQVINKTITPVIDSVKFTLDQIHNQLEVRIKHPQEEELWIPLSIENQKQILIDVFFQNNWEAIPQNTRYRYKVQNIRTSSFLIEKVLVKKKYFCVFIRKDQADRLMEKRIE